MTWVIRFILLSLLITLVVRAAIRFFGGMLEGATGKGGPAAKPMATKMVKDPVCGTYVVPSKALTASRGNETAWFCSAECQQAWQRR
jgi:YHS domain-containing protein